MKIAIVGGGPAGLYLSILLKRRQPKWPVTVLEQNSADSTFGFGVVLASTGLQRLRAADEQTYDRLVEKMTFTTHQVITHREVATAIKRPNKGGGAIARIDLLNVLQREAADAGVEIRYGVRLGNPAELAAHGLGDADVVVGSDGINSLVRTALEPEFGTSHSTLTNHFAWYGVGKAFPSAALVFRDYRGGAFVAHYYPYTSDKSTFVAECDHTTWEKLGMEAMSNDERQQLFETVFAPELDGHGLISNNSNYRQFPVIYNANWVVDRCVLLGDAQTSAHFSIGSGTRIAMDDSIALADALVDKEAGDRRSVDERLAEFAAARQPQKDKLISASRKSYLWYEDIGKWMQQYGPLEFIYAYMSRTGRMSDERLRVDYPELMQQMEQAGVVAPPFAEAEKA